MNKVIDFDLCRYCIEEIEVLIDLARANRKVNIKFTKEARHGGQTHIEVKELGSNE